MESLSEYQLRLLEGFLRTTGGVFHSYWDICFTVYHESEGDESWGGGGGLVKKSSSPITSPHTPSHIAPRPLFEYHHAN
jgi:hypothetical protein